MLIDRAMIQVRSGKGGSGVASFRREKYINKGGPNGGDGGNGADVILIASEDVDTLLDFAGRHHWHAENGGSGATKQMHGRNGAKLEIRLPPGTLVYNDETGELIIDLAELGDSFVIAKGGRGGFGNEHFKSPTNQTPYEFTIGEPAVELIIRLELKLVADVGLIGMPNAGKSTLLSTLTAARPKIADYPFTTLEPNLGIAEMPGEFGARRLVIADIPGLIEGAAGGAGLGHEFLRHVERTRVLVHLLEIEPVDESDPAENYHAIQAELTEYSNILATKLQIVAVSKMDLLADEDDHAVAAELLEQAIGQPVVAISSVSGDGMDKLLEQCWRVVQEAKKTERNPLTPGSPNL